MNETAAKPLAPRLRFPTFRNEGDWTSKPLGMMATVSTEKVGSAECVPMSVTSGVGLVSQEEKFGRVIAGDSYKNYVLLRPRDFAYNKSATKEYPEGFLTLYRGERLAAVPNSIFTCFSVDSDSLDPDYLAHLFRNNLHGRWLRQFIQVGARAHGSLSISDTDLMALPVPLPRGAASLSEQQKIADCLNALDDLIAAQARKVGALRTQVRGLTQLLLPGEAETQPRWRFPEFRSSRSWQAKTLGGIAEIASGSTPSRSNSEFFDGGTIPWVKTTDLNNSVVTKTEESITPVAKARINPPGSVLVAMYGGLKQIGRTGCLGMPAATNQAISVLQLDPALAAPSYVLAWLNAKVHVWHRVASSSRKDPNITGDDVARFPIMLPGVQEQDRIASCLTSLNDLIEAGDRELKVLKTHKKAMMQQLFPLHEGLEG